MEYIIYGKKLDYQVVECGIYKSADGGFTYDYAVMDISTLVSKINTLTKDKAIQAITGLRDLADNQIKNGRPRNPGFPILRQTPEPEPMSADISSKIRNTYELTDKILEILQ